LVSTPYEILADAAGLRRLAYARELLPRYQGNVGAARRAWAAANGATLEAYIRAYLAALDWLFDPANRSRACAILCNRVAHMQPALAERTAQRLLDPDHGLQRHAAIDIDGIGAVLALRSRYATPVRALTDPERYVDLTWYARVRPT
jgi:ABC-type nitrate/sulfonate/bicarbonate transport system substrate-binding protein